MTRYFLTTLALLLVIEGIMPFLSPRRWRNMMLRMAGQRDSTLRFMGLLTMAAGVVLMYLVHSGILWR